MKKVIALISIALLVAGSAFAMDMSIAIKGTAVGGALDIIMDLYKGFGVQNESDIITSKLSWGDGLIITNDFNVNIPVMAWYNHDFNRLGLGGEDWNAISARV